MHDGAGNMESKQVIDVLFELVAQVGGLSGKIEGLVTHERQAEKVNAVRMELLQHVAAIEKRLLDLIATTKGELLDSREERMASIQREMKALEGKVEGMIATRVEQQVDGALADQEKHMKRAQTAMWTGGSIGVAAPVALMLQHFFGGGG